ncbi:MAG TPA: helix-turn-helix domain-containing protein [Gaiellaceae bacterium]|jgi:excisionase family DNA binding protein
MTTQVAPAPRLLRTGEVAALLGVSPWRVLRLVEEGVLAPVRFGVRGWSRFRVEDVERLIRGGAREP